MARRRRQSQGGTGCVVVAVLVFLFVSYPRTAIALAIVAAVVWLLYLWFGRYRTQTAQELAQRFAAVGAMSGGQFEIFMADVFRAMGHQATVLGGSGDQGVDLIVRIKGQRAAVQCKNYKRAVGNKPVQEVFAGAKHHRCELAWVVAPAGYTKGAFELARSVGVSLFDANAIRQWIREVDKAEKERLRARQTSQPQEEQCWKCGAETGETDAFCRSCGAWLRSQLSS